MLEKRERQSRFVRPVNISGWVLVAGFALFAAFVYLFTQNGCDNEFAAAFRLRLVTVDTWEEWREHLAGTDLYLKYNAFNVSYNTDMIREDFVRYILLDAIRTSGKISLSEGTVLRNDSSSLHVDAIPNDADFDAWKKFFEGVATTDWSGTTQEEYYVHASIASLFHEVVLHGPNDQTASIAFPFIFDQ